MRNLLNKISLFTIIVGVAAISAFGQEKFSDPNVEYEFILPSSEWKMISKPTEYSPNVEYVYKDKQEADLQVRNMTVGSEETFSDILKEEELKLQFMQGYVAGKQEDFRGNYPGKIFNFEYLRSGKAMAGRFYYLRTSPTNVYVLRFTGLKESLKLLRNETDSIARTFVLKAK